MLKKNVLALAATLGLVAAGSASAGEVTDTFDIRLTVGAYCALDTSQADMDVVHDPEYGGFPGNNTGGADSRLDVLCNLDLPYTVAVDSSPIGEIFLVDSSTSKSITAHLHLNDAQLPYQSGYWGTVADGYAYANVGTGNWQAHGINMQYQAAGLEAVGVYTATKTVTVNF